METNRAAAVMGIVAALMLAIGFVTGLFYANITESRTLQIVPSACVPGEHLAWNKDYDEWFCARPLRN